MFIAFLLATTTSLVVLLSYKVHTLKKDRDRLLNENNEEAKVLFLQSRYASMGETVGNIAHQWKQPLNAIGAIQNSIKASLIFQGDISKEKLLSSVETSFKLLQHLAETIDTFYSFLAQRGDGKKSFIIADELEKVRKITEYSFENSNITLNFILDANPTIQGNANEFTHAILNLILNAKDAFDDSTSDMPIITVHVSGRENYCTIVICDTAGGIRLNPVEMVFDMHITTKESGSGLGLFMTKKIIEQRFGGSISVENRHDGACFTIELPYAEYGDYFNEASTHDEMLTLERINHLSRKVIELEDLEKTLKKWSDIFKQAHWGIAMHSEKDNTFELTNAAFNTLYGYSAQELKSIRVSDLFTSDSLPMLSKIQQEAKNKGFVVFEAVHKRKDGSTFPASVELIVIKNDEGEVLYHIANIWDLTEKKEAEERLLLKKFALDHIQDAVFMIDENARFHYVNQGACTALGYSREEFESMNVGDVDPDWPAERWNEHWEILKELGSITMELRHRRKDGTIFPVEVSANYIEFGDKHYNMAIARDITERKAAEKELLLVDKALNNTTEAAYIFINEHVVQVNDGACKMLGYSREELISMTLFDFDKELTKEGLASLKDNHKPNASFRFERQHTTKEGRILNVEIDASQFEYDGVTYSFTTVRDITEQKQAREELLLKEFALNTINEAVYLIDENSMFHYVNEGACTALGYTKEELMQKGVIHIDPNATPEWWNQHWNDLKEQKNMFIEASHRRKDGTLFPIELSINYFEYNGIGYNLAVARDITERRLLEEQKDNERMRLFFERQLVGMAIISPEYGWIHTNEKLQQMLGYTQDELTKRTWVDMTYPEDLAPELEQYRKLMNGEIEDYTLEKRLIRKDGNLVYTNLAVSCVRNDEGSVNYILALLEDISERKQMQAQLIASEREFRSLTEHIPDNIIRWDRYGRYLYINPVHERTLGLRSSEVIGHRIPDEHESIKAAIAQVVTSGQTILVQQSVPDENGDIRIHDVTLVPEWDDKGEIVSILGLGRDMTDIYRLQNDLEKHRSSLVEAQKLAKIGSWDFDLKTNNLSWSDEYFQILELDPTNDPNAVASFETFFERVHPEDREFVSERFNAWQMSMEPYNTEHRLLMPDGRVKFVHQLGGIRCDQNGTPLYAMGTVHDITERKVMETALQESNDRYIQILDNSSDVIYLLDVTPQGRFIYVDVNAAYEEVTGIPRDVVIGLDVEDIEDETFRNILIDKFTTVLNSGEKTDYTADYPFPAGVRTFHSILLPIRDESGRIVRIVGAARDITERQEMEEALKKALEFNEGIIAAIPDLLFELAPDGTYIGVWAQDEALLVAQKELLLGNNFKDLLPPETVILVIQALKEVDEKGNSLGKAYSLDLPDGKRWFELSVTKKKTSGNYIVLSRDITERKELEEELLEQNQFLDSILNAIPVPVFYKDTETRYRGFNKAFEEFYGKKKEEMIGKGVYDLFPPEQAQVFFDADAELFRHGGIQIYEHKLRDIQGIDHDVIFHKAVYFDKAGSVIGQIGTILDITERKELEINLEKERKFLNDAQRVAHIGSWHLDIKQGLLTWSDETYRIFELDKEQIDDLHKTFYECVHPDDREMVSAPYLETLKTGLPYQVEHRIVMADGRIKYVIESCEHIYDDDGTPLYSIGTVQEITERKKIEEKLQEKQAQLSSIISTIPDMLWVKDSNGVYLLCNTAYERFLGAPADEIIGKTDYDFVTKEQGDFFAQKDREALEAGKICINEEEVFQNNGQYAFLETRKVPVYNDQTLVGVLGIGRDITDNKRTENTLKELNETLEKRVIERTDLLSKALEFNEGIINALPDLLFELDSNGTYLNVWARDEELLAAHKELLLGQTLYDALSKEAADTVMEALREADHNGTSFGNIIKIDLPQGTRYFEESVSKKASSNTFLVLSHDITERIDTEKALRQSEETFRAIVENSPDVISRYDLNMHRTYVNPMMQFLLGKPLDEIIGKTPREFSPLPDIAVFEQLFDTVVNGKNEIEYDGVFTAPWGERRWGNQRIIPEFDEDRNVTGVMVIGRDMTERVETEKRLKLLETAVNNAEGPVFIVDDHSSIIYVNDSACDMLGYTRDELIQMKIYEIDTHLSKEELTAIESGTDMGKTMMFNTKHKTKNGHIIDVEVTLTYFEYDGVGFGVSVVKEITEQS